MQRNEQAASSYRLVYKKGPFHTKVIGSASAKESSLGKLVFTVFTFYPYLSGRIWNVYR